VKAADEESTLAAIVEIEIELWCLMRHKVGHVGDVLPSQSLGLVMKKLNITQQK